MSVIIHCPVIFVDKIMYWYIIFMSKCTRYHLIVYKNKFIDFNVFRLHQFYYIWVWLISPEKLDRKQNLFNNF